VRKLKIAAELEKAAGNEEESKIIENYLYLMSEAKALKVYIAKLTNKTPNVLDFQTYGIFHKSYDFLEQEVRIKYKNIADRLPLDNFHFHSNNVCCASCNIF
jgi:hypothetical protein